MQRTNPVQIVYKEYHPKSIEENYVMESTTSYGFLQISKIYYKLFGVIRATVLQNYLEKDIYFKTHFPKENGWFFLTHKSIAEEYGMKEYTVQTAKNDFEELGILETEMRTNPTKQWIKINYNVLDKYIKDYFNSCPPPRKVTPEKTGGSPPRKLGVPTPEKTGGYINNTKSFNNTKGNKGIKLHSSNSASMEANETENNKSNSILDEKQKAKEKELRPYKRLADLLADFIEEKKQIKITPSQIKSWSKDFYRLFTVNGVEYKRQKEVLEWYFKNHNYKYTPVIESGASFRAKFVKLQDAIERGNKSEKQSRPNTVGHLSENRIDYSTGRNEVLK